MNSEGRRVVVGIDGSEGSRAALRFAREEAGLRGASLHAVHAWRVPLVLALPTPRAAGFAAPDVVDPAKLAHELAAAGRRLLDEMLAAELGVGPALEIRRDVVEAGPVEALLAAGEGAELLVVGSRGRGGFAGLLLGSVGQQCAQHARCPVAIVPRSYRKR
jgi:nucleotide-binding universal stress UspA family protein